MLTQWPRTQLHTISEIKLIIELFEHKIKNKIRIKSLKKRRHNLYFIYYHADWLFNG